LVLDDLASIFSLNNWPGHISYVIIGISYWLTDILWLRSMAIVGLSLEILYFVFSGGDLRTGIGWDTIFIAINLYQLYRLWKERLSLQLPEADRELLHRVLPGLNDIQIARLLLAGEFSEIAQGTTLTRENETLQRLFFICAGRVTVMIAGRVISRLEKGNFVGEVAFLTEKPATATVITESSVRAIVFDREKLSQFFRNEAEVAGLIYQLLGRELALKIKVSNSLISTVNSLA
jgi:Cyclic nucleotide-binding domain